MTKNDYLTLSAVVQRCFKKKEKKLCRRVNVVDIIICNKFGGLP